MPTQNAGRPAGTGIPSVSWSGSGSAYSLAVEKMPLTVPPLRGGRFGSPLVLSRVHWVRPEVVVEVSYLTWTEDGLLRHVVYLGEREDKPANEVVRELP
jgi:bifunctional non-homologous end joining protein LigD